MFSCSLIIVIKAPSQKKAKIVPIVALKIFNQRDPIKKKYKATMISQCCIKIDM